MINLVIEHATTADMADGQVLPPVIEDGLVWRVVRRTDGRTLWRRISLSPSTDWRAAPADQARAP